jgi:hypothetical protein
MAGQPTIVAGLVGVEVVEQDVDLELGIWIGREALVHEVEELAPPPALSQRDEDRVLSSLVVNPNAHCLQRA